MRSKNFERYAMRVVAALMQNEYPVIMTTDVRDVWLILQCLQAASRHPELGKPIKENFRRIADGIAVAIIAAQPDAQPLIDAGWNEAMDIDTNRHSPDNGGSN